MRGTRDAGKETPGRRARAWSGRRARQGGRFPPAAEWEELDRRLRALAEPVEIPSDLLPDLLAGLRGRNRARALRRRPGVALASLAAGTAGLLGLLLAAAGGSNALGAGAVLTATGLLFDRPLLSALLTVSDVGCWTAVGFALTLAAPLIQWPRRP